MQIGLEFLMTERTTETEITFDHPFNLSSLVAPSGGGHVSVDGGPRVNRRPLVCRVQKDWHPS
jgi:hypothetical protein